ncbi:DUF2929 family protein [Virgibacillus byunsanensis]|uniref:DUF2929 family protein n=1 Tax=Virgibacillus byunsanensis TaxID=570945 RepID=A0ABW3LI38_9BACI
MRFISAIFWALLISGVISYVLSSMAGDPFNFTHTIILAGILSVGVFALGGALKEESDH